MDTRTGNELVAGLYAWRLAFGGAIIGAALASLIAHAGGMGGISPDIIGACLGFGAVLAAKYVHAI